MISDTIITVRKRVASICSRMGKDPHAISLVAVSKGRTAQEIIEALDAGITDIGENKVQEASLKHEELRAAGYANRFKFHMVGHLQTNKVKEAVRMFDLIQSVDSLHLAEEINARAAGIHKVQDILVEIKVSSEATKYGLQPHEAIKAVEAVSLLRNVRIRGLMAIAPVVDDPLQARPYFRKLTELLNEINAAAVTPEPLTVLSMGMSDDFESALTEGSNMIRIGRALFEGRA
jgi:pyridoxal phosphate enzyme (YggS family)